MTGIQQRLANPQYANWLKAGLCLITLKEGLATFTEAVIKSFHRDILASLPGTAAGAPPTCGICSNDAITYAKKKRRWSINCTKCDQIIETLQDEHVLDLKRSVWNNTDVSLWYSDAWEIAKFYMNPGQKPTNKSPADSDCSGLVNLILHCRKFHGYIAAFRNIFEEIRNHRNNVMHSESMEVTDAQLIKVIEDIITVLKKLNHCYIATKTQPALKTLRSSLASSKSRLQQTQSTLEQTQSKLMSAQSTLTNCQQVLSVLKRERRKQSFASQAKASQILFDQAIDSVDHALSAIVRLESSVSQAQFTIQQVQLAVLGIHQLVTASNQIQSALDPAVSILTRELSVLDQQQTTHEQVNQARAAARGAVSVFDQAELALSQKDTLVKQVQTAIQTSEQGLSLWHQTPLPLQQTQICVRQALLALEKAGQAQWDEAAETTSSLEQAINDMKYILSTLDKEEQGLSALPAALVNVKQTRARLDHERDVLLHQQSSLNNARCDLKQAMEALTALQQVTEVRDSTLELTTHDEMQAVRDKMDALERRYQVMNQRITALDVTGVKTEEDIADLKQTSRSQETGLTKIATQYESLKKLVDQIGKDNHTLTAKYQEIEVEIQKRIFSLSNKILAVDQRVDNLERRQQEMQQSIKTNQEGQQTINEETDGRLSTLEQTVPAKAAQEVSGCMEEDRPRSELFIERLSTCVVEGSIHVLKTFLQDYIETNNYESIDDFLQSFKKTIYFIVLSSKVETMFPSDRSSTDMSEWDVSLYFTILLYICNLSGHERSHLNELRLQRNNIYDNRDSRSFDLSVFKEYWGKIEKSLVALSKEDGSVESKLTDIKSGTHLSGTSVKALIDWYNTEKLSENNTSILVQEQKKRKELTYIPEELDRQSQTERLRLRATVTIQGNIDEDVDDARDHVFPLERRESLTDPNMIAFHDSMCKEDEAEVISIQDGSIIIVLECFSIKGVIHLWKAYESGQMASLFERILHDLRLKTGREMALQITCDADEISRLLKSVDGTRDLAEDDKSRREQTRDKYIGRPGSSAVSQYLEPWVSPKLQSLEERVSVLERQPKVDEVQPADETRLTEFLCKSYKDEEKVPVLPLHREVSLSQIFAPIVIREDLENGDGEGNPGVSTISTPRSRETNTQISSYFDMFHKEKILQKNIFMLGQAGSGKTTFCKHLVDIWCRPSVTGQYKGIEVIRGFEFVFLVKCRNAKESDTILDMIFKQCLCDTDSLRPTVTQVLRTKPEKCLILIDGLDEWAGSPSRTTGPKNPCGLPSRQGLENCVVMTTSRPWRVEALTQGLGKHHRILEIKGLTDIDMKTLSKNILSALKVPDLSVALDAFLRDVKDAKLTEVVRTPLMLIIVLTFWLEAKRKLDRSVCVNFSGLLESLIQRAEGRSKWSDDKNRLIDIPHFDSFKESLTKYKKQLPSCFRNMAYCGQYSPLIFKLAQFAFDTLFRGSQERSLVFGQSDLKQIFNETELSVCLNIGILSLATAPVKSDFMENMANISFFHKSLQEYLAALYMASDSFNDCLTVFKSHCKSLTNVFDYSKVVLFVCGLAPVKGRELLSCIGEVPRADPVLQEHRQTVTSVYGLARSEQSVTKSVIRLYQLALDCSTEASHSQPDQPGRHLYHYMLPDVYVGEEMSTDQRVLVYDQVQARRSEVKSLIIDNTELAPEIEHSLHKLVSLERLHIELPSRPSRQQFSRLCHAISELPCLRSLYMKNCWPKTDVVCLLELEHHRLLREVALIGRLSIAQRLTTLSLEDDAALSHPGMVQTLIVCKYMRSLRFVRLVRIQMSAGAWRSFLFSLPQPAYRLTVQLEFVNIDADIVADIKRHFTVTRSDTDRDGRRDIHVHSGVPL